MKLTEKLRDAYRQIHRQQLERPGLNGRPTVRYRCTRCYRSEVDARANGCARGPCPMDYGA